MSQHHSHPLPPFAWPKSAADVSSTLAAVLKATEENLAAIEATPNDELTEATLLRPLMCPPNYKTNPLVCQSKFMQHCSPDAQIREAASAAGSAIAQSRRAARLRTGVFEKVQAFAKSAKGHLLNEYKSHFLDAIVDDYVRGGLLLSDVHRGEFSELLAEDTKLCSAYSSTVAEENLTLEFSPEDLQGCSEEFISQRTTSPGVVTISLKYPDLIPVMSRCEVAATRKRLSKAREGAAYEGNLELMCRAIAVRQRIAQISGHQSWAEFTTKTRMARTPEAISSFLGGLSSALEADGAGERQVLLDLKAKHLESRGEANDGELNAWDTGFYGEMYLKSAFGVDEEAIQQYFPADTVVAGTLAIYQELLGLQFVEINEFDSWHDDVRLFVVYDTESSDLVGHFYLDLYPRQGKYSHAAIFHLLKRSGMQVPCDCMLTNLPAPTGGKPALLRHSDVVTFFHEFGHIMHGLCAVGDGNSTHLAKCPRDFVEAPSQMLENWCWNQEVLQRLSCHHETRAPLPRELMSKMLRAKNVGVALSTLRQVYLASLDMALHGPNPPPTPDKMQDLVDHLRQSISQIPNPTGCSMLRSFGHLMNQYSAAYYGYLWSEVLSADMFFARFGKEGIFNPATGKDYREMILAPGGVGAIEDHVARFLGRLPNQDFFLESKGLKESADAQDVAVAPREVYALHLVVPAGAATELIESISKSANKYGKKMQFHKPGMKEAPNPVWDAFFCENSVPHVDLQLSFRASVQERALLEAEISDVLLGLEIGAAEELCLSTIDGTSGGTVSLEAQPTAKAIVLRRSLRAALQAHAHNAELGPEDLAAWSAPIARHDVNAIPLATLLGFVDELLRSNGSAAFRMTTLAIVKCLGEHSYSMCRTWEFGDLPKSAVQNMGEIESAKVDVHALVDEAAKLRANSVYRNALPLADLALERK